MTDFNPVGKSSDEFMIHVTEINIANIIDVPPALLVGVVHPDEEEVEATEFYQIYYRSGDMDALVVAFDIETNIFVGLVTVPAEEVLEFDET